MRLIVIPFVFLLFSCGVMNSPNISNEDPMDLENFWKIMDYAHSIAKFDITKKKKVILAELVKLTPNQIQEFEIRFQELNKKSSTQEMFAAHTIIEGGSSDDTFFYFRCWLISLGKKNFEAALNGPDYLAEIDIPINEKYGYGEVIFEDLILLSDEAYGIVTKSKIPNDSFPRSNAMKKNLFYDSGTDIIGKEWDYDDLLTIAPKLFLKFNN